MDEIGLPEAIAPGGDTGVSVCVPDRRRALNDAWARMHDKLRRAAKNVLRDGHEAEDAAHDAFIAAFQGVHTLRDPERIDAWLMRITRNVAMTQRRRTVRVRPHLLPSRASMLEDESLDDAPWERLCSREPDAELLCELRTAIDRLPPCWRDAFRIRVVEGKPVRDAARDLGISEACLKTRLARVWRHLREAISDDG